MRFYRYVDTETLWVLKRKRGAKNEVTKHKARCMYNDKRRLNRALVDTFSPAVRHSTIRTAMAVACIKRRKVFAFDVTGAYLQGRYRDDEDPVYARVSTASFKIYMIVSHPAALRHARSVGLLAGTLGNTSFGVLNDSMKAAPMAWRLAPSGQVVLFDLGITMTARELRMRRQLQRHLLLLRARCAGRAPALSVVRLVRDCSSSQNGSYCSLPPAAAVQTAAFWLPCAFSADCWRFAVPNT